jgi:hypothetical protein
MQPCKIAHITLDGLDDFQNGQKNDNRGMEIC